MRPGRRSAEALVAILGAARMIARTIVVTTAVVVGMTLAAPASAHGDQGWGSGGGAPGDGNGRFGKGACPTSTHSWWCKGTGGTAVPRSTKPPTISAATAPPTSEPPTVPVLVPPVPGVPTGDGAPVTASVAPDRLAAPLVPAAVPVPAPPSLFPGGSVDASGGVPTSVALVIGAAGAAQLVLVLHGARGRRGRAAAAVADHLRFR